MPSEMPVHLAQLPPGTVARLGHLDRIGAAESRRLLELGLTPGSFITVLHKTAGGGRIVAVAETRIAIDRGLAARLHANLLPDRAPA